MAAVNPATATSVTISQLLQRLGDLDPDFRFMSLNDLLNVLVHGRPDILQTDYNTASRTVDNLVRALDDQNGEVQNLAIKCLGPLVGRIQPNLVGPLIEKLSTLKLRATSDNAVPSLALKAVIEALPHPVPGEPPSKEAADAYLHISRVLIPRLIGRSGPTSSSATASKNARSRTGDSSFESNTDLIIESVDVVIEVARCFGPLLQPIEVEALQDAIVSLLQDSSSSSGRSTVSSAVKKRAVVALSILAVYLPDEALSDFITQTVKTLNNTRTAPVTQRLHISILGSMARSIPQRFGRHVDAVAPVILASLSDQTLALQLEAIGEGNDNSNDFNEIREAALVALEAFLASCPNQMRPYTEEALQACLRYLKYDPNYIGDDDDEMEDADDDDGDDGFGDDDEFEADGTFDDDGDGSWKLRRCAAKAMRTLISTRSSGDLLENGVLYREAAPLLIQRFSEREETVRIEIISDVSLLVRKTGEGLMPDFALDLAAAADGQSSTTAMAMAAQQAPLSRKRRRQSSSGGNTALLSDRESLASPTASEKPVLPLTGPRADLAECTPSIVAAAAKLLKGKQIPTKQSIISLLDDIVTVQHGGLADFFLQILGAVLEAVKPASGLPAVSASSMSVQTGSGTTSVTPATMRVAALRLLGHIYKTHSLQVLQAYLPDMVDVLAAVVRDRFYKISAEAISAAEEVVKLITPPRAAPATAAKFKPELQKLYLALMDRVSSPEVDAEVRQKAIQALGTLLSHTGAADDGELLLSSENRRQALEALLERLQNETTRLASVRAIDRIAAYASSSPAAGSVPFDAVWTRRVAVELSSQLRKANRSLRGSSIQALRHLVQNSTGNAAAAGLLDNDTLITLVSALQPVFANTNDAQLLGPALRILASLVQQQPQLVVTPPIIASLCALLRSSIVTPSVLDPVLRLVTVIGRSGHGQPLMAGLLQDFGVATGDPAVVGKVIGALLVAGGASAGVSIDSFIAELKTAKGGSGPTDPTRASLAITVLGEAGLRLGTAAADSPIQPALFLDLFASESDKVSMSAAVALGRAAAGNVPLYLPVVLNCIDAAKSNSNTQYLTLQSLKEVLQQVALEQNEQSGKTAAAVATDISPYTTAIWTQLLAASDVENNKAACAECLGRLVMLAPLEFMARLGELLTNAATPLRAMALQALRYTLSLSETGSSGSNDAFDAYLREQLVPMLHTAQKDPDLEIRRLAMTALNSAAHNKPELIMGQLNQLLPFIMEESKIKPQLIREVQMGPFKHLVDDGLEVRKGAYETLYALMETAFSRISVLGLFERILAGLADDHDIRSMCNLMLSRLAYAAPEETARHLDSIAERYRAILSTKLKDNAVKQEHEKQDDANKGVLRTTMLLAERLKAAAAAAAATAGGGLGSSSSSSGTGSGASGAVAVAVTDLGAHQQKWLQYCEWVNKTFEPQLRSLREETRDFGGSGGGGARSYIN